MQTLIHLYMQSNRLWTSTDLKNKRTQYFPGKQDELLINY